MTFCWMCSESNNIGLNLHLSYLCCCLIPIKHWHWYIHEDKRIVPWAFGALLVYSFFHFIHSLLTIECLVFIIDHILLNHTSIYFCRLSSAREWKCWRNCHPRLVFWHRSIQSYVMTSLSLWWSKLQNLEANCLLRVLSTWKHVDLER